MKEYHFTRVRTEMDYITIRAKDGHEADKKLEEENYDDIATKFLDSTTDLEKVEEIEEDEE